MLNKYSIFEHCFLGPTLSVCRNKRYADRKTGDGICWPTADPTTRSDQVQHDIVLVENGREERQTVRQVALIGPTARGSGEVSFGVSLSGVTSSYGRWIRTQKRSNRSPVCEGVSFATGPSMFCHETIMGHLHFGTLECGLQRMLYIMEIYCEKKLA